MLEKKAGVDEDRTIGRKLYIDTSRSLSRRPTPRELRTYRERVDVSAVALLERVVVLPPAGHASTLPSLLASSPSFTNSFCRRYAANDTTAS
jgi:hypothetical protein